MFPFLNSTISTLLPIFLIIALLSIYHSSIIAFRQLDLKKLIAYSSIAHMAFVIFGIFSLNLYGFLGSLFIMFSHGFVASSLFFLVGVLYERYKSRNILDFSALSTIMPLFSIFLFFSILANLSFPGTSNFIGELLVLFGLIETNILVCFFATLSIILTASYSI
jgi:NADH-quinone oxidoreductase subunit M